MAPRPDDAAYTPAEQAVPQHSSTSTTTCVGALDLLTDTLLSHLAYEEGELMHPLARNGFG